MAVAFCDRFLSAQSAGHWKTNTYKCKRPTRLHHWSRHYTVECRRTKINDAHSRGVLAHRGEEQSSSLRNTVTDYLHKPLQGATFFFFFWLISISCSINVQVKSIWSIGGLAAIRILAPVTVRNSPSYTQQQQQLRGSCSKRDESLAVIIHPNS